MDSTDIKSQSLKSYELSPLGELTGHNGWVTAIAATHDPSLVVSSSRDKTLILWKIVNEKNFEGKPLKRFYGHEHFVQDVKVSSDGRFALSGSWDKTLRLWDLESGESSCRFVHHKNDVLSVSFSVDNRQICSGSRDNSVALWNTVGQFNFEIEQKGKKDWISCVAFSPEANPPQEQNQQDENQDENQNEKNDQNSTNNQNSPKNLPENLQNLPENSQKNSENSQKNSENSEKFNLNFLIYASWNGSVHKFDLDKQKESFALKAHDGPVTSVSISPDASLCASGGRDGRVLLWELRSGVQMRQLALEEGIVSLKFNPNLYWLCAVSQRRLVIWNLVGEAAQNDHLVVAQLDLREEKFSITSVEWSVDGGNIMVGFSDGVIRVWQVVEKEGYGGVREREGLDSPVEDFDDCD